MTNELIESFYDKLREKERIIKDLEDKLEACKILNKTCLKKIKNLETENANFEKHLKLLKDTYEARNGLYWEMSDENERLHDTIELLKDKIKDLETENKKLKEKNI